MLEITFGMLYSPKLFCSLGLRGSKVPVRRYEVFWYHFSTLETLPADTPVAYSTPCSGILVLVFVLAICNFVASYPSHAKRDHFQLCQVLASMR